MCSVSDWPHIPGAWSPLNREQRIYIRKANNTRKTRTIVERTSVEQTHPIAKISDISWNEMRTNAKCSGQWTAPPKHPKNESISFLWRRLSMKLLATVIYFAWSDKGRTLVINVRLCLDFLIRGSFLRQSFILSNTAVVKKQTAEYMRPPRAPNASDL